MKRLLFAPEKVLFTVIDLQLNCLGNLDAERRESLVQRTVDCSQIGAAFGVQTLCVGTVAYNDYRLFLPTQAETEADVNLARREIIDDLFGPSTLVRDPQPFFLKGSDDLFGRGRVLDRWLQKKGIETLLFAGMHTHYCVPTSIVGALNKGYNVIVLTDLLADGHAQRHEGLHGGNPEWHQDVLLQRILNTQPARLGFSTSLDLVASMRRGFLPLLAQAEGGRSAGRDVSRPVAALRPMAAFQASCA